MERNRLRKAARLAAVGVGVGRLGSLYDLSDRGKFLIGDPELQRLPFAVFTEQASGGEWRLATFCLQAVAAWALALILGWVYLRHTRRMLRSGEKVGGRTFVLFLALYGAIQAVLDSTRYDADFFRFNGFIHMPQVLCAAAVFAAVVWFSVKSVRKNGFRWTHGLCWLLTLGGMGLAGYMEYFVQRHADRAVVGYGLMSGGMALAALAAAALCASLREPRRSREKAAQANPAAP